MNLQQHKVDNQCLVTSGLSMGMLKQGFGDQNDVLPDINQLGKRR